MSLSGIQTSHLTLFNQNDYWLGDNYFVPVINFEKTLPNKKSFPIKKTFQNSLSFSRNGNSPCCEQFPDMEVVNQLSIMSKFKVHFLGRIYCFKNKHVGKFPLFGKYSPLYLRAEILNPISHGV